MRPKDDRTKEEHFKDLQREKNKHYAAMEYGGKKPSERAREVFRRPPYAGLFGESKTCAKEEE